MVFGFKHLVHPEPGGRLHIGSDDGLAVALTPFDDVFPQDPFDLWVQELPVAVPVPPVLRIEEVRQFPSEITHRSPFRDQSTIHCSQHRATTLA